jgi:hypothetical protein
MCSLRHSWSLVLGFSLLVGSGCSDPATNEPVASSQTDAHDHGEHDHGPESLKEALAEVTSLRNIIRDSFAKNDQEAAHGPLHEVGEILEAIPELAKKEKVSPEDQTAIESSVNTLMDAFGRVDKTMHGQEGSTYAEESATIDKALNELAAACDPAAGSDPATASDPAAAAAETAETPEPADPPRAAVDDDTETAPNAGNSP